MGGIDILLGAFANWYIRGGGYKQHFKDGVEPFNIPSKLIYAVLFGAYVAGKHSWKYGLAMGVAMLIGQAPSLFNNKTDIAIANKQYMRWASQVWLRGLIWVAPMVAVSVYFTGLHGLYFGLAALLMPVCYLAVWFKPFGNRWFNGWVVAEMAFGALLWWPV